MLDKMLKNKTRLALKMFIILWFLLFLQVILKLTFNYWQPYVIPTPQLEVISNFIDSHLLIKLIINKLLWFIGTYFMILCGIQQWKFKNKKIIIILIIIGLISLISNYTSFNTIIDIIITIFTLIILPLIINYKKWLTILITFVLNFVFLYFSLWLEGFNNVDDMKYIVKIFFQNDYYIMLVLNYMLFNFVKIRKGNKNNGR